MHLCPAGLSRCSNRTYTQTCVVRWQRTAAHTWQMHMLHMRARLPHATSTGSYEHMIATTPDAVLSAQSRCVVCTPQLPKHSG